MRVSEPLSSVSDIIDALGGPSRMAGIFGGGPSRFCNYRSAGRFPESMHMRIYVECLKRGLSIAPELVGMSADVMAMIKIERQRSLPLSVQ